MEETNKNENQPADKIEQEESKEESSGKQEARQALCVELDFAVLPGIKAFYDVCSRVLAEEKKIELDVFGFARFCVKTSLQRSMVHLKVASGQEAEELAEKIHAGVAERLLDPECPPREGMPEWIRSIRDRNVRVILVSYLPEESLGDRIESLGLSGDEVSFCHLRPERTVGYGLESWKKMASRQNIVPRRSLAVVGSGFSAKSALTAGFKVLAFPDERVAFEDYSGVDGVFACGEPGVDKLALDLLMV